MSYTSTITRILHLSDFHIDRNVQTTTEAIAQVHRIIESFGQDEIKPWVLVTGDTVDDGKESQFVLAQEILSPLRKAGFELHFLPGNHDYGWNGNISNPQSFSWFCKYLAHDPSMQFPKTWTVGKHFVILLDSMKGETGWFDHILADGEIGEAQLKVLDDTLLNLNAFRKARKSKVIVALHHHPFIYPDNHLLEKIGNYFAHQLKDGDKLLEILADRCDVLLFGHEHRHLNFSKHLLEYDLPNKLHIPMILSCGSSGGIKDPHPQENVSGEGRAWLISIVDETGEITVEQW